jgi:hypothetical protein
MNKHTLQQIELAEKEVDDLLREHEDIAQNGLYCMENEFRMAAIEYQIRLMTEYWQKYADDNDKKY